MENILFYTGVPPRLISSLSIRTLILVVLVFLIGTRIEYPWGPTSSRRTGIPRAPYTDSKSQQIQPRNVTFVPEPRTIPGILQPRAASPDEQETVAQMVAEIQSQGKVRNGASLFYSALPNPGTSQERISQWYCQNVLSTTDDPFGIGQNAPPPAVTFDIMFSDQYLQAQTVKRLGIEMQGAIPGPNGGDEFIDIDQTWSARAGQAFGEEVVGLVFIFTPPSRDARKFASNTVWGGFEFPALTRNSQVTKIVQVDINLPLKDSNGNLNPRTIWVPSDGPSQQVPQGDLCAFQIFDEDEEDSVTRYQACQ